jgi:formate hydrogenlyase subunit 3/multisubunit Na+/H+ antiporter MnhD subunit
MTSVDILLLLSGGTFLLLLALGRLRLAGPVAVALYAAQLAVLVWMGLPRGDVVPVSFHVTVLGHPMGWRYDGLSWYFALITVAAALLAAWYAAGAWSQRYAEQGRSLRLLHATLALNVFTMLLLIGSGDLLALFVGWELVSWASFLLMALGGGEATRAALKYLTYAIGGAMAILGGLVLIFSATGSFDYSAVAAALPTLPSAKLWTLVLLFGGGFGVKMGLLPFHLWQAEAYARTPGPGAAFLGAISSRMGLFAIVVVLVQLVGVARLVSLEVPFTFLSARDLLAWVAALTIILPTFTALKQNDARMLLAWHGIGQGGYMLMGVMLGDAMGSAGGLMHVFNHATYQAALFMSVFAVVHRTGTADLNKLGGLVTRMPLSFLVMLIGIIGLAGLPPMNGFVSKWLVYRALITEGMPLLFLAAVIGTLGTILSVYKLIHNMFLGQLRLEHMEVSEAPLSMLVPMLILSVIVFVTGLMPGIPLAWVAAAQAALGLPVIEQTLGGVQSVAGSLDMIWIVGVLFGGFGVGALVFYRLGGKSKRVHQLDNYAGGHFLTADVRYQYSDNFYAGLMHLIGPWYRGSFQWLENGLTSAIELLSQGMAGLYRATQPASYLLAAAVLAFAWVLI